MRAWARRYYWAHAERERAQARAWHAAHPDWRRQYRRRKVLQHRRYIRATSCPKCGKRGHLMVAEQIYLATGHRYVYHYLRHVKSVREGARVRKIHLGICNLGAETPLGRH